MRYIINFLTLLLILHLTIALERGFARPDKNLVEFFKTEHRTLVEPSQGKFLFKLDPVNMRSAKVGLSVTSLETSLEAKTLSSGQEKINFALWMGRTVTADVEIYFSGNQNKIIQNLKVTLLIVQKQLWNDVIFLNNIEVRQQKQNILKQNQIVEKPIFKYFIQGVTMDKQNDLEDLDIQFDFNNRLISAVNKDGKNVCVVLTILILKKESQMMFVQPSPTDTRGIVQNYKGGQAKRQVLVKLTCPLSFRYYNTTNRLCQFSCFQGYYGQQSNTSYFCIKCHYNCLTCDGPYIDNCLLCSNKQLTIINGMCGCPQNHFLVNSSTCSSCSHLISQCYKCEKDNEKVFCKICQDGYYLHKQQNKCEQCSEGCRLCSSARTCLSCNYRYQFFNGTCWKKTSMRMLNPSTGPFVSTSCSFMIANCATRDYKCMKPPSKDGIPKKTWGPICNNYLSKEMHYPYCITCDFTYYVSADQFSCLPCPNYCYTCTGPSLCLTCVATFSVLGSGLCGCDAAQYYFYDSASDQCKTCSFFVANCITCNQPASTVVCTGCSAGYALVGNTCTLCPTNCTACADTTLVCSTCINPSYSIVGGACQCTELAGATQTFLNSGSGLCQTCQSFVTNCVDCNYNASLNVDCINCAPTYRLNLGTCVCDDLNQYFLDSASNTCTLCSNLVTSCLTCSLNSTSNLPNCDVCANNHIQSWSGIQVVCLPCIPPCLDCSGTQTNCISCQTGYSGIPTCATCTLCMSCDVGCMTCNVSNINQCYSCLVGYYHNNITSCLACPSYCLSCQTNSPTCLLCDSGFILSSGNCICNNPIGQFLDIVGGSCQPCSFFVNITNCQTCTDTTGAGNIQCLTCLSGHYHANATNCQPCGSHCLNCTSPALCLVADCASTFTIVVGGDCFCDNSTVFYDGGSDQCQSCSFFDTNCQTCTSFANALGVTCSLCNIGYLVNTNASAPFCASCPLYCDTCLSTSLCDVNGCTAGFIWDNSTLNCTCDTANQYHINTTAVPANCQLCSLSFCINCSSLTTCQDCDIGYFVSLVDYLCSQIVCGDGQVAGSEECDDMGVSGGCDSNCKVVLGFVCPTNSTGHSVCTNNPNLTITQTQTIVNSDTCNYISFTFILTGLDNYLNYDYSTIVDLPFDRTLFLTNYARNGNKITLTYNYFSDIQARKLTFLFNLPAMSVTLPVKVVQVVVNADNNLMANYYYPNDCNEREMVQDVIEGIQYSSFGVLILSAIPCKIVGLQLFGVLQLAYIALGNLDGINLMLTPMLILKQANGFTFPNLVEKGSVPSRVNGIEYDSNFLNNCNVMMLLLVVQIVLAVVLYLLSVTLQTVSNYLAQLSSRFIKQILLTLILFNSFNIAYSAGLHFAYNSPSQPYYLESTILSVLSLALPLAMCIGLTFAKEEGFGQFKDKFKADKAAKLYFVMTLLYRNILGFYMATQNQDNLSAMMVMAISIAFLLYSLVNLPFTKAYHNYRANICHLTNFVTLFVVMFYRSMMSSKSQKQISTIYTPAYIQLACIVFCVALSAIILIYQIYIYIKEKVESCNSSDDGKNKIDPNIQTQENTVEKQPAKPEQSHENIFGQFNLEDI